MKNWTPDRLPDLAGRTFYITGANSGIGLEATKILCARGARVILGARSEARADAAMDAVREAVPGAQMDFVRCDLADLDSVSEAAAAVMERAPRLDALVNNAGVMQPPYRKTKQGFELQFGTNHLGHFRLTALLYERLKASAGRVVCVSSIAHHTGRIDFDDLQSERSYAPTRAYCQSKLANLVFAFELDRRCREAGSPVRAIPVHPGYSATNLQRAGVGMEGGSKLWRALYGVTNRVVAQSPERGAYPICLAAADPEAEGGTYYGPTWFGDTMGPVGRSRVGARARDRAVWRRLWEVSEELVGPFPV